MCIVIDINTIAMVFNEDNDRHEEFCCVKRWIEQRKGVVVFGGTKYKSELSERRMRFLRELKDSRMAVGICDAEVDKREKIVIKLTEGTACDDQHIVALLGVSGCALLCSGDNRSFKFVKKKDLYPDGAPRVKILSSCDKNKHLLVKTDPSKLKNVDCPED